MFAIVFSGDLAPQLYLSLMGHQDGGVAEKWNRIEAGYTRGLLKVKGLLSITKKSIPKLMASLFLCGFL